MMSWWNTENHKSFMQAHGLPDLEPEKKETREPVWWLDFLSLVDWAVDVAESHWNKKVERIACSCSKPCKAAAESERAWFDWED